ncbi:MAG TPA: sigma 54-interacting transcriptional regulator [Polyangia bacterium]|nr:sigma 54-interacting transcriptional regulator [Polyangia bacterium]
MVSIGWQGPRPPAAVRERLVAAGLRLEPRGDEGAPRVLATADARRVPAAPAGAPWIWVCATEIPLGRAAEAVRAGAYEVLWLREPDAPARLAARLLELVAPEPAPPETPGIIAESAAARRILRQIWRAARTAMPVLITGETGTGKEVMAALVHRWSRRPGPYVPVNCAAIPNELMESELFGHIRGAFSGAVATVDGKLLAAREGTVFLDEIDDTPLSIQAKLLRVLEDGQVTRVGETTGRQADFRIVAATNRDLHRLIAEGRFGDDLYQRLAIVRVVLPPLRERPEDIPVLARHFIARFYEREAGAAGAPRVKDLSERALAALVHHPWPGNIRELRNVIYQALVYKRGGQEILLTDLRPILTAAEAGEPSRGRSIVDAAAIEAQIDGRAFNLRREIERLEREALRVALHRAAGRPTVAARLLGEVGHGRASDPGGTVRAMMRRLDLR